MLSPDMQRINHIRDYCIEIENTISRYGEYYEVFQSDHDYQRSVSFCILQIGELSGGLSMEYRKRTAHRIQWGPMKAIRNLVAHDYVRVELRTVWATVINDIPVLKKFCEEQLAGAETEDAP